MLVTGLLYLFLNFQQLFVYIKKINLLLFLKKIHIASNIEIIIVFLNLLKRNRSGITNLFLAELIGFDNLVYIFRAKVVLTLPLLVMLF